jgi:anti-sigma B factor antagonist
MDADRGMQPSPALLEIELSRDGDGARVAVAGDLDMSTADQLAEALDSVLADDAVRRMVLDFAGVAFMASAGVAVLVGAYRQAQDCGVRMMVVSCRPSVARVMEITGVDKLLTTGEGTPP